MFRKNNETVEFPLSLIFGERCGGVKGFVSVALLPGCLSWTYLWATGDLGRQHRLFKRLLHTHPTATYQGNKHTRCTHLYTNIKSKARPTLDFKADADIGEFVWEKNNKKNYEI